MSNPTERSALAAWERSTEVPLLLLAIAFLAAWAWPVIDRGLSRDVRSYLGSVSWTVWGAFACDFAVRLTLAGEQRAAYARKHWYDIALICLPLLRPLRLLRLITLLRVIDRAGSSRANRALTYVLGASVLAVTVGAIAVLDAEERNPGANIKTIGDALWWACTSHDCRVRRSIPSHGNRQMRGRCPHVRGNCPDGHSHRSSRGVVHGQE